MSTVAEIEAAIRALTPSERERLADHLPAILPELNGDAKWERLTNDERRRASLSHLGDEIAAQFKANPSAFAELREANFDEPKNKCQFSLFELLTVVAGFWQVSGHAATNAP